MKPLNTEQVDFLSHQIKTGKSIPGQSLTNSPEEPYNWERPPEFTNYTEASDYMFSLIFNPNTASNLLLSINNGVGVIELTSIILYTGFLEGKWNPDLMMLLSEPTMYMIIALCEKADLTYNLESTDEDTIIEEMSPEKQVKKLNEGTSFLKSLRTKVSEGVNEQAVSEELKKEIKEVKLPSSLLEKQLETEYSDNSLLLKGEQ